MNSRETDVSAAGGGHVLPPGSSHRDPDGRALDRERLRILEMVQAGTIRPEEADELLAALRHRRAPLSQWLFRPMELLQTGPALAIGAAVCALGLLLARLGARFDGALDLHTAPPPVPWGTAITDQLLAWPLTALIFWAIARPVAGQGRLVDFLASVGIARLPLLPAAAILVANREASAEAVAKVLEGGMPSAAFLISTLATIPFNVWFFVLLVTGLRTASGLRGGKLAAVAVGAILAAEVLTKLALLAL